MTWVFLRDDKWPEDDQDKCLINYIAEANKIASNCIWSISDCECWVLGSMLLYNFPSCSILYWLLAIKVVLIEFIPKADAQTQTVFSVPLCPETELWVLLYYLRYPGGETRALPCYPAIPIGRLWVCWWQFLTVFPRSCCDQELCNGGFSSFPISWKPVPAAK